MPGSEPGPTPNPGIPQEWGTGCARAEMLVCGYSRSTPRSIVVGRDVLSWVDRSMVGGKEWCDMIPWSSGELLVHATPDFRDTWVDRGGGPVHGCMS